MPCKFGHAHVHVKQVTNQTCSTACVEMVCRRFGGNFEYAGFQVNFYNACKPEEGAGLTHGPIRNILTGLGYSCTVHDRSVEDNVGALFRQGSFPIIAEALYKRSDSGTGLHWVVVDGRKEHTLSTDEFCILDPSQDSVIYAAIPKKGHATYDIADGRTLLFTGRMIHVSR